MLRLTAAMLRAAGFTDAFEIAEEVLKALRADTSDFDLIASDFNMLNGSGLEVALAMRNIRPDLPVVIISGFVTDELLKTRLQPASKKLFTSPIQSANWSTR